MLKAYWWKPLSDHSAYYGVLKSETKLLSLRSLQRNFGDELTKLVLEQVDPTFQPIWTPPEFANFFGIGSILNKALRRGKSTNIVIWGSGLRQPLQPSERTLDDRFKILALRGKRTAYELAFRDEIPLGDPALLVQLMRINSRIANIEKLFIPHFSFLNQRKSLFFLQQLKNRGYKVMYPFEDPYKIIDAIGSSKVVVSSALHCLIVADALGIPSVRFRDQNESETNFKFEDYHSAIDDSSGWLELDALDLAEKLGVQEHIFQEATYRVNNLTPRITQTVNEIKSVIIDWKYRTE